jgi:alcohol dehydrogenase class IV
LLLHPYFLRTAPAGLVREAMLNILSTAVEAGEPSKFDPVFEAKPVLALRAVARNLDTAWEPGDISVREYLAVTAVLYGCGTDQAGGGRSSVPAHAIGYRAYASNGIVYAIMLPHIMRFDAAVTEHTFLRIADSLRYRLADAATDMLELVIEKLPITGSVAQYRERRSGP